MVVVAYVLHHIVKEHNKIGQFLQSQMTQQLWIFFTDLRFKYNKMK